MATNLKKKYWLGPCPERCDICSLQIGFKFVDGNTEFGGWAIMCGSCHNKHGYGLGTGKGQLYDTETMEKIKG